MDIFNIETKKDRTVTSIKLSLIYIFASVIWIFIYEKIVEVFFQGTTRYIKGHGLPVWTGLFPGPTNELRRPDKGIRRSIKYIG